MKAIVLSSGGVDSSVCLALAIEKLGAINVLSVSFFYGQKHKKELESASKIAEYYGVKHIVLDIASILQFSSCPLMANSSESIEHSSYADQIAKNGQGKVATYVPFRNGLMLSAAASLAQSLFPDEKCQLYIGSHADDATGNAYADCSESFDNAMGSAISIGTYGLVSLEAPLAKINKAQVVAKGLALKVPFKLTWSCYEGGERHCGTCATCIDRKAAFRLNGVEDPVEYANSSTT